MKHWAMLAKNYREVSPIFPYILQPKLNGVRAMWNGQYVISRQGKIIPEHVIPHIYSHLRLYPKARLDGELYHHLTSFQDICGILAQNRKEAHPNARLLDFHVFDAISDLRAQNRIEILATMYSPTVPYTIVRNHAEVVTYLTSYTKEGYEGVMLRALGRRYTAGRTDALLKYKPLKELYVTLIDVIEGKGKFANAVGAFVVKNLQGEVFKIGGGNITEQLRKDIWQNKTKYLKATLTIQYSELSRRGIPLKGQLVNIA